MAAHTRPTAPYGKESQPSLGLRLLAWLRAHPFDAERVKSEAWAARALYAKVMR